MTHSRNKLAAVALVIGTALVPFLAVAQTDRLQLAIDKCAATADIATKAACFDSLSSARKGNSGFQGQPGKDAMEPKTPGVTQSAEPQSRPVANDKAMETLQSKVTFLKDVQANKVRLTLANGQVWQQDIAKPFVIKVNDTARIAPSGWGSSFRLEVEGHPGFIQVSRLR